jgi:hypothetical protein
VANAAQYRNIGLAPGGTLAVQLTASVPCVAGRYKMTATAKVSPTFSGPVFGQSSVGPINVTGGCSLAFSAEPANANVGETISSEPFTPGGAPISVAVLDSSGNQTSLSTGNVSIAIGSNPTGGTLSGTTSRGLSGGVATFDNLSIDTHGIGYTLVASFGSVHATSDAFTIADAGSSCSGNCTTSTTADDGTGATITNFSDSGDVFLIFGLDTLDCPGYGETTATLTFGSTGNGEKLVTLTIPADVFVRKPDVGWQVCFGTDDGATFTDQNGNTVSVGLLPECGAVGNVTPCVVNRINNPDGSFSVIFRAPAGDPKGRL